MNDQVFTDTYTQIFQKIIKIFVARNIIRKIVFMVTKLNFQCELNLWISINFWNR